MKFINMFLIGYFVLVVGITMALWQTGVLKHMSPIWVAIGVIAGVAASLGFLVGYLAAPQKSFMGMLRR